MIIASLISRSITVRIECILAPLRVHIPISYAGAICAYYVRTRQVGQTRFT